MKKFPILLPASLIFFKLIMTDILKKDKLIGYIRGNRLLYPLFSLGKKYVINSYRNRKLIVPDFPYEVWIENTNHCNAKCVMCPREKLTRKLGFMEFPLFEKLIREISEYRGIVKRVHLHNYGEPLLDKDLIKKIKLAKDHGIHHTYFVTNGSLLNKKMSESIIEAGLDEMKISFYGTDKETYKKAMKGLNFNKSLDNLKGFFKIRKALGKKNPKVVIQYVPMEENGAMVGDFVNQMSLLIDEKVGDMLNVFDLHNYSDGRDYLKSDQVTGTCPYPWNTMVILYDGKVVLCCADFNGVNVLGDVNKNKIHEIWNSGEYRKLRKSFKKVNYSDFPLCEKCSVTT